MESNYWRHSEITGPDTTNAFVIIPNFIAITISHSAATANATTTKGLPWWQLAAEHAAVARPGAAGKIVSPN